MEIDKTILELMPEISKIQARHNAKHGGAIVNVIAARVAIEIGRPVSHDEFMDAWGRVKMHIFRKMRGTR